MNLLPNSTFKKLTITGILLVLILSAAFLKLNSVRAQTLSRTFTVTPPTVEVNGDPGYYTEGTMGVINESDQPVTYRAVMADFIVEDNAGTPQILPANSLMKTYSAAAWMGVSPQIFTINPGKRQNLNYFIQIPGNARPGGHYAAVVFTPVNPTTGTQTSQAVVNGEIGTLFSIGVNGPIKESALVTKFLANLFQEYGPAQYFNRNQKLGRLTH